MVLSSVAEVVWEFMFFQHNLFNHKNMSKTNSFEKKNRNVNGIDSHGGKGCIVLAQ